MTFWRVIPADLLNVSAVCARILMIMSRKRTRQWDVLVVGAGASGMMAAISAARRGRSVLLIDRMDRAGKKLLATGNGKCNYTNAHMDADCFHGDRAFVSCVLNAFSHEDCVRFFREIGIYPKEKNGYFYPNSEQALSVLLALEWEMARSGVQLVTDARLLSVKPSPAGFVCETNRESFCGRRLILATGLTASPKLGSDGSAFPVLRALGHRLVPVLPALCGFYCSGMNFRRVSGVRCDAALSLVVDGACAGTERGQLQLTDYGLSGIPVFQLSAPAVRALSEKKSVHMRVNFLPDLTGEALCKELAARGRRALSGEPHRQLLCGLLHEKLIPVFLDAAGISEESAKLTEKESARLIRALTDFPVTLLRGREAEYAQVCAGGVRTDEVNPKTMESRLCPGVYLVGELLDVDGLCGGYNLQWAWSTGYVAGNSV